MFSRTLTWLMFATAGAALAQPPAVVKPFEPITPEQRLKWFANAAVGPSNTLGSLIAASVDTWRNSPSEYGPHWAGYGKRFGLRSSGRAMESGLEAGLGAIWGEDPRYFRVPEKPFMGRVSNVIRMTVITHDSSGHGMPAYARFVAAPAVGFLSNAWVPDSQHSTGDAFNRIGGIFANQLVGNAFSEFWPDVRRRVFRRFRSTPDPANSVPPARR